MSVEEPFDPLDDVFISEYVKLTSNNFKFTETEDLLSNLYASLGLSRELTKSGLFYLENEFGNVAPDIFDFTQRTKLGQIIIEKNKQKEEKGKKGKKEQKQKCKQNLEVYSITESQIHDFDTLSNRMSARMGLDRHDNYVFFKVYQEEEVKDFTKAKYIYVDNSTLERSSGLKYIFKIMILTPSFDKAYFTLEVAKINRRIDEGIIESIVETRIRDIIKKTKIPNSGSEESEYLKIFVEYDNFALLQFLRDLDEAALTNNKNGRDYAIRGIMEIKNQTWGPGLSLVVSNLRTRIADLTGIIKKSGNNPGTEKVKNDLLYIQNYFNDLLQENVQKRKEKNKLAKMTYNNYR